ncbi:UvrD-helicase domain-containing protein [candidate division KSB1 bacterium]|nr:UvrD-helicase domain-containing protein [candidate division KSB1 bacterium]
MRYIADLHIHSYFSRATSKTLNLEHLNYWGQLKGLKVIATGDLTHPQWLQEMREKLQPAEDGLFQLKSDLTKGLQSQVSDSCRGEVRFILSGEISCIYKKGDRVRKIHHVVFFPEFDTVARFQQRLEKIGNIRSDGRPILGLDSRDLLEIVLESDERAVLIPAHIWTPWFSLLGSKSGFLSVEECFEDLSPHIFALETGLSSDPPMNWRLTQLDRYVLVSNSDAHSPEKLAREANIFETDLSYPALFAALRNNASDSFWGTIEFFPQEGKYHFDGHRKCDHRMHPRETLANQGLCPVCGKPAVLGVSYQVEKMADRPEGQKPPNAKPFLSLVPLPELLSDVLQVGAQSKKVRTEYHRLLQTLGPELAILMDRTCAEIEQAGGVLIAEAIRRMREGQVHPEEGYDGEYGIIRIFQQGEREKLLLQGALFEMEAEKSGTPAALPLADFGKKSPEVKPAVEQEIAQVAERPNNPYGLNPEQWQAVSHRGSPLVIHAGPGTGKTRTLVYRLAGFIEANEATAEGILAVTFTNRAADEMRDRLRRLVGPRLSRRMHIQTFHALGAELLRELDSFLGRKRGFRILDPATDEGFLSAFQQMSGKTLSRSLLDEISRCKTELRGADTVLTESTPAESNPFPGLYRIYESVLIAVNAVDFDDLIMLPVRILRQDPEVRRRWVQRFQVIAVDEFQDLNLAQYELFKLFSLAIDNVCIIGDPNQAIYAFRGADYRLFYRFQQDFGAEILRLHHNYRSAQNILDASRQILDRGDEKVERIWSGIDPLIKCRIFETRSDRAEAETIVHQIEQLVGGTSHFSLDSRRVDERGLPQDYAFGDLAILLRSKRQAPPLYEALHRSGIPFETLSDHRISDHSVVRAMSAAAALIHEPQQTLYSDLLAWFLPENNVQGVLERSGPSATIQDNSLSCPDRTAFDLPGWAAYCDLLEDLRQLSPEAFLSRVFETAWQHMRAYVPDTGRDALTVYRRLLELARSCDHDPFAFKDQLFLHREIDAFEPKGDRIHILTLHASKGLEFPVVVIPGCEDGVLPFRLHGKPVDLEEERRLLYVGMTRAQSILLLTHARRRLWFGKEQALGPSPFLASISQELAERRKTEIPTRRSAQLSLFEGV